MCSRRLMRRDAATQPLPPYLGPGSIQGPDRYSVSLEEPPLHRCIFVRKVPMVFSRTDLGAEEGVQKKH